MNYKISNTIKQIDEHVREILALELRLSIDGYHYNKENSKDFLHYVAEFFHFLIYGSETAPIIKKIFDSRLEVEKSGRVVESNTKVKQAYQKLAIEIIELKNWEAFSKNKGIENQFVNPFELGSSRIGVHPISATIVEQMKTFDSYSANSIDLIETVKGVLVDSGSGLNGILNRYERSYPDESEKISEIVSDCFRVVNPLIDELKEIFEFNVEYSGFNSIEELLLVYENVHPNVRVSPSVNAYVLHYVMTTQGLTKEQVDKIKKAMRKAARIIKNELSLLPTRELVINRFKAYAELYRRSDFVNEASGKKSPEKIFQKYWEEFAFQAGYYPISEAQLESGRLDTLLSSPEAAFLTEIKQVGFGSGKTSKEPKNAFSSAVIQASSYRAKLNDYPLISRQVYVLLFSNETIVLTPDRKEASGIEYHLIPIQLTAVSESKRKPKTISIDEIVK